MFTTHEEIYTNAIASGEEIPVDVVSTDLLQAMAVLAYLYKRATNSVEARVSSNAMDAFAQAIVCYRTKIEAEMKAAQDRLKRTVDELDLD